LLEGLESRAWDYEARERGSEVEINPLKAMSALKAYRAKVEQMNALASDTAVQVSAMASSDGPSWETRSSLARELAFVLSHTIHHNAMIAVSANALGKTLPKGFGYAPATTAFLQSTACARSQ
jgi:hypothetical protein